MADFVEIVGLGPVLARAGIAYNSHNFEELYARLVIDSAYQGLCDEIESHIQKYFASLELPNVPTIYDQLLLSLRDKDVIATFNWDPFLIQSYRRNAESVPSLPQLLFLHGNVLAAYCATDDVRGVRGARCSKCGQFFVPTPLLFPIREKKYSSNPAIARSWDHSRTILKDALFVTVFGYGAPQSDVDAIAMMTDAWGKREDRQFEQFEIIDIRGEAELRKLWKPFIHTHHYDTLTRFADSWIAKHPRRTIEAFFNQYIKAQFIEDNPVPLPATLAELSSWFAPLSEAELGAERA